MVNIAILGYGTVGGGVYEVIRTNQNIVNEKSGEEINVKYVLDLREFPGDVVEKVLVHDFNIIVNDPEVKVVVETMGGTKPAYEFVKKCLKAGKSVCTSNKELVAKHGCELLSIAQSKSVSFLFEASVGGGIPIIRPLDQCLTADKLLKILGIVNGTTNYILTQMDVEGWDFDKALKTAQELGYAERNPEADIEGFDACRKIAILSSIAYGKYVDFEEIYTEGISKITALDIKYAKEIGRAIKLLASSFTEDGKYYAMVAPFMVPASHPLYSVSGVFNAIFVKGNVLGDTMYYGSGAGKLPTASAVVSDVVDAVKNLNSTVGAKWDSDKLLLTGIENAKRSFFVRVEGNIDERISEIEEKFGKVKTVTVPEAKGEFGFVTDLMSESQFNEIFNKLKGAISRIRLES